MATIRYFSDLNGETHELTHPHGLENAKFTAQFPGVKGKAYDSFTRCVGYGPNKQILPVTRKINYKAFPSKHVCDARCMGATGKTMNCECSCGGKNHGKWA